MAFPPPLTATSVLLLTVTLTLALTLTSDLLVSAQRSPLPPNPTTTTTANAPTPNSAVLQTTLGPVQGLRRTVKGREVDVYHGIPFAKPPVGELRYRRPVPPEPWTEVRAAVTKPNTCFQTPDTSFDDFLVNMWNPNTPLSEDCLYLNVWVPRGYGSATAPRATLVWIFGGGFWSGTSTLDVYDGAKLAATENVVVVSMNYRVSTLGFLYMGTEEAPGNQGLLDQVLALKWVHENVDSWGGTRETVTLFGESAGAASIGFHLMSPLSMNYFARVVLQSASPTATWAVTSRSKARSRAQQLATIVGCPSSPVAAMMDCMRRADAQNVTDLAWEVTERWFDPPMAPVVDQHFLMRHPNELMARGEVKDTQILMGANKDEGMFWLVYGFPSHFPLNNSSPMSRADFLEVVREVGQDGDGNQDKALIYEYDTSIVHAATASSARSSYRDMVDDIVGDKIFICPVVNFGNAYVQHRPSHDVYLYSFEHRLSNTPWPAWMGVLHGFEIEVVFGLPRESNFTQAEEAMAERVTGYLTRFAQFGDPNGDTEVWPKLTTQGQQYLKLTDQGDTVEVGLRHRQCTFRSQILPLLDQGTVQDTLNLGAGSSSSSSSSSSADSSSSSLSSSSSSDSHKQTVCSAAM